MAQLTCVSWACASVTCYLPISCLAGGLHLPLLSSQPPGLWRGSRGMGRTLQEKGTEGSADCARRFRVALLEGQMLSTRSVPFTASQLKGPVPSVSQKESLRRRLQTAPSAPGAEAVTSRQGLCRRWRPARLHHNDVNNEIDSCSRRVLIRCSLHEK